MECTITSKALIEALAIWGVSLTVAIVLIFVIEAVHDWHWRITRGE